MVERLGLVGLEEEETDGQLLLEMETLALEPQIQEAAVEVIQGNQLLAVLETAAPAS
jgi:hypothetical protein